MALAVVRVIALNQALTLVALDGPGCSASHSPGLSLDTSSPRWPWL